MTDERYDVHIESENDMSEAVQGILWGIGVSFAPFAIAYLGCKYGKKA